MKRKQTSFLLALVVLALTSNAMASTTWYVNGVTGKDTNNCKSPTTACKTIKHAISLASSGDSIMVAAASYKENLTVGKSLKVIGSGATATIIDGGGINTVISATNTASTVTLSHLTIRNGKVPGGGGGIFNNATMMIASCLVTANVSSVGFGGGIVNSGKLTITNSTISGNSAGTFGGGIANFAVMTINDSTISGNKVVARLFRCCGGVSSSAALMTINNSTVYGNLGQGVAILGGGGKATISNSTVSGNGLGIELTATNTLTLRNSIVANNLDTNCELDVSVNSKGYNLSSDKTCNFNGPGDMNNTNPMLGALGNNGGPTQTIPLLAGSPAIDAGNPSGCTDGNGHLLKTDQRGKPRPDPEDAGGCDIGAFERQGD